MVDMVLPDEIHDEQQLEDLLSAPTGAAIDAMGRVEGDIMLLGVAGKMGPTLARMARRASDAAGVKRRIIGVSRFSTPGLEVTLQAYDIETIRGDLLDESFLDGLPEIPNLIHLAVMKFGASNSPAMTWAMNVHLPAMVCRRFRGSRIASFSTGNVYPLVPINSGGSRETNLPGPVGEYAMTALGRERMFAYFSERYKIPTTLVRLNYAAELRYGVPLDIAQRVFSEQEIDLSMGYANLIWQGDANAMTLASLADAASPPFVINVAGPELVSVREMAQRFGQLLDKTPRLTGTEAPTALLSDGSKGHELYGRPRVTVEQLTRWIAGWVRRGGRTLGKPTHFEVRDGKF
jgi:nucleoside-diphosphate-sugar epimerase